jgi:malate dehydrogenase (oxaloacetate-decarboxylating)(NADP+)
MFMAAARTLATLATPADLEQGSLYPPLADIRRVSARIATAVAEIAFREKLATVPQPRDILAWVESSMYQPRYDGTAS